MDWIMGHWKEIFAIATAIMAAASVIANMTPNETDNKVVAFITKIVNALAGNFNVTNVKDSAAK